MKRIIFLTLTIFLTHVLIASPTFAGTKEAKLLEKVKSGITRLGTGTEAHIKVKLKDGTKIEGYITESNENEFVVMNSKTNQIVPVAHSSVKQVKGNNLSKGVIITIGVVAFLVLLFVLVGNAS